MQVEKVTVDGAEYVFGEVGAYGNVPAWKLIKQGGKVMTAAQFDALPDRSKHELLQHLDRWCKANGMGGLS